MSDLSEILQMRTLKHVNENAHINLRKPWTTSILLTRAVPALRAETARRVWIQWTIVKSNFYTLCISQESQVKTKK